MRRGRIASASALILGVSINAGAYAAEAASAAEQALRELAVADGVRLSRASWCGYEGETLERLVARLRVLTQARAHEAGIRVDEQRYDEGVYAGMEQAMLELLKLPAEQIADEQSYRARHCAEVRVEIDALLRP